jgi:SHS2 domain-containing protein
VLWIGIRTPDWIYVTMKREFEEIDHTADIAMRVWGRSLAELFANAAYALAYMLAEDVEAVVPTTNEKIELEAEDTEILLVDWLSELLYLGERDNLVFTRIDRLNVTPNELHADVLGGPNYEWRHHIKAVTFSELDITQSDSGYETVIVFDV